MKIELADINTIKPYPNNPRKLSETAIEKVSKSIQQFGFRQPIVVDKDRIIVVGHTRYRASKKLGYKQVPITIAENLTKEQINAYRIADNRTNEEAKWDDELLKMELKELEYKDFDLKMTGFDDKQINDLLFEEKQGLTDDDAVPDTPEEPITKLGDIWQLGKHRLLCGDATKEEDVNKLMDGAKADMVFTDPPYGMNLKVEQWNTPKKKGQWVSNKKNYTNIIGDHEDFSDNLINTIFSNFSYVAEIFIFGADYFAEYLPKRKNGSWIVWDKRSGGLENVKWKTSEFELCWSKIKHQRKIARIRWMGVHGMEKEDTKKRIHPTQKPVLLISWFFDNWGNEDDIIVDLYLGSGSTLIACEKLDRICYGMELDPKYCDVIVKRWEQWTGEKATK
jgi:site-specific DNA-methyltransferase (adenine-specific)